MIPFGLSGVDQDTTTAVSFRNSTSACFGAEGAIGIELEVYESMFCVTFRNVRACSVKADSVLEKGPTPADVSAAICTETVEYFCTPGNVLIICSQATHKKRTNLQHV